MATKKQICPRCNVYEVTGEKDHCKRCTGYIYYHGRRMVLNRAHWRTYTTKVNMAHHRSTSLADDIVDKAKERPKS